ncbi:MAG: hypothetical protein KDA90_07020 [Planctomycetaceae bacterium]|nr:hypothetical protein [Planctomycetaceae bacterium]
MLGKVDLPHSTGTDRIEDQIIAEYKPPVLALIDSLCLKLGQFLLLDQQLGKFLAIGWKGIQ